MAVAGAVTDLEAIKTTDITFESDGASMEGYLAGPRAASAYPAPSIIVLHGVAGLGDHWKDLARRFANVGYIALAPSLYSRVGSPPPGDQQAAFAKAAQITDPQAVRDLEAAAGFLRGQGGASGKVGLIGFSMGGRFTLLTACSSQKIDAAVDCWGGFLNRANPQAETTPARPVRVLDLVDKLHCPLFAAFGADDPSPTPAEAEELGKRLKAAGKEATIKVYPNAGHNFLMDVAPDNYREVQANELWGDVLSFFGKSLGR